MKHHQQIFEILEGAKGNSASAYKSATIKALKNLSTDVFDYAIIYMASVTSPHIERWAENQTERFLTDISFDTLFQLMRIVPDTTSLGRKIRLYLCVRLAVDGAWEWHTTRFLRECPKYKAVLYGQLMSTPLSHSSLVLAHWLTKKNSPERHLHERLILAGRQYFTRRHWQDIVELADPQSNLHREALQELKSLSHQTPFH